MNRPRHPKHGSTFILRAAVLAIALTVLLLCIFVLPAGIRSDATGMYRVLLLGMYVPAVPFFFALFEGWKLLGYVDQDHAFSSTSVKTLRSIKYCGLIISLLYLLALPYVYYVADHDDAPGVMVIGCVIIFASFVVSAAMGVLEALLGSAIELKSENDLTV